MDTLNSVEIKKVKVTPLSEWNYLLTRTPPSSCEWPRQSNLLCWWCAHSFSNVPAYLPVKVFLNPSSGEGKFVFTGNFCSWNCVKRYAMMLENKKKFPDGCFYIGLLAFLTVCKGNPCEGQEMHDLGLCECMETYQGVHLPPSKEMLAAFGGQQSIEDYRKGFHLITDYEKIKRNFTNVNELMNTKNEALKCKNMKFWGFHYLHYAGPDASYTTFVNILPLTNRTFDKKTLVLTGNETGGHTKKMETTAASSSSSSSAKSRKPAAPKAQKISSRRSAKGSRPVEISSCATVHASPPDIDDDKGPNSTETRVRRSKSSNNTALMTNEEVLACNDEQQFYTNSLRGYGNILTSMGIEISRN